MSRARLNADMPLRQISAGTGLTGGGTLEADRTISAVLASQAEAEAGTVATKLMTPLQTAQAIAAQVGGTDFTAVTVDLAGINVHDITGLSGITEIYAYFHDAKPQNNNSRNGIQIGDAVGIETTDYKAVIGMQTTCFNGQEHPGTTSYASAWWYTLLSIRRIGRDTWAGHNFAEGYYNNGGTWYAKAPNIVAQYKVLEAELNRIRLTTGNGVNWHSGTAYLLYR